MLSHSNKKINKLKRTAPIYKECPDLKPQSETKLEAKSDDVFVFSNETQTPSTQIATDEGSVISNGLTIEGRVKSMGVVRLEGALIGNIQCRCLVVEPGGSIEGNVWAEEVKVDGHVKGTIYGRNVVFQARAVVEGDVYHQGISIDMGAHYDGYLKWKEYDENERKHIDQIRAPSRDEPFGHMQAAE